MSVIRTLQSLAVTTTAAARETAHATVKPYSATAVEGRVDLLRARTRLLRLFRALEALADAARIETRTLLDITDARSRSPLGLDLSERAARLQSSNEINASPMSFSSFGPAWNDGSSALITIGGEYDGSHGTGQLSFEVRRAGTRGVDDLRIRVEDPQGNRIRNVNVRTHHALDRQYDLQNGLYLTLSNGDLINRDLTTIQVNDSVGAAVNPNNPLGGIRNQNPNLEYGSTPIVDGGFQLNGTNISVATTDSINDVIDRINASGAGVTALFNPTTERIEFEQDTIGSAPTIDLQSDTSNFLAATKLDSANTVAGREADNVAVIGTVTNFSSVLAGTIIINDKAVSIDPAADSLEDVVARINAAGAAVSASFDADTQEVTLRAGKRARRLDVDSNGTGFFEALQIDQGQYQRIKRGTDVGRQRAHAITDQLSNVVAEINYLFRDSSFEQKGDNVALFRSPLESAARLGFGSFVDNGIGGLALVDTIDARRRGGYAQIDRRDLTRTLRTDADAVMNLLRGQDSRTGFVERMFIGTQQALRAINAELGIGGSVVDFFA